MTLQLTSNNNRTQVSVAANTRSVRVNMSSSPRTIAAGVGIVEATLAEANDGIAHNRYISPARLQEVLASGDGGVAGPISSTDNAVARWDGVSGSLLQDSSLTLSDNGRDLHQKPSTDDAYVEHAFLNASGDPQWSIGLDGIDQGTVAAQNRLYIYQYLDKNGAAVGDYRLTLNDAGVLTLDAYGAGTLTTDASGVVTAVDLSAVYQPLDSDLTAIAALTTTAYGRGLLELADETALEALLDTLPNLTSIQGRTVTLADAGADALFGWDDSANAYQNLSAADAITALGLAALYQPLDSDLTSWAGVTRAAGFDTWVATPSSANLRSLISDETGTGALYFQGGDAGTPSALVLTNATGLTSGGVAAATLVTAADTVAGNDNDTTWPTTAAIIDYAQPLDSDLTAIAALTTTAYGRGLLELADETALEALLDTLPNLTSIQGRTVTLADAGADALFGWDDSANAYQNLSAADAITALGLAALYQPLDSDLTSWAGVTRASGFDTWAATPSSANLRSLMSDETGTGVLYFQGGDAGTPSALVLTNATGLTSGGVAAATLVTAADTVAGNDNDTTWPTTAAIIDYAQPLDSDLTAISALTTTAAGRSVLTIADPNIDRVLAWDDSAGAVVAIALADINTEATPASGDYILIYDAAGNLLKTDWANIPTGIPTTITVANEATDTTCFPAFFTAATGDLGPKTNTSLTYNSNTGAFSIGTSAALTAGSIELGHASANTLTASSGDLSIEGNVVYRAGGTDVALADGGTGASLSDPNIDRVMMWDDSAGAVKFGGLTDINTEAAPTSGDYVLMYDAAGNLLKTDWANLPGAGGGLANVVEDTTPQLGGDLDANGFDIQFDNATGIRDDSDNEQLIFAKTASAVNYWQMTNSAADGVQRLEAAGSDTHIAITIASKGTDPINFEINGNTEASLTETAFSPGADGGNSLGTTTLGWQNLFGNTGFVFNLENGDWVATHTAGILTVGTGDLRVTNNFTNAASVVTVGGAQTLTNKTLTSPVINTSVSGTAIGIANDLLLTAKNSANSGEFARFTAAGIEGLTEAEFKAAANLEANTDFYAPSGTDVALADGGTGASLSDPNIDRVMMWDDSAGAVKFGGLTDINTEASPASGDYVLMYDAAGNLLKTDWANLPGAGGGISNVVEDTTPQLGGDLDANGFDIQFDDATGIRDDSDNELLIFQKVASAVNYIELYNAATGNWPQFRAAGSDSFVPLSFASQGDSGGSVPSISFDCGPANFPFVEFAGSSSGTGGPFFNFTQNTTSAAVGDFPGGFNFLSYNDAAQSLNYAGAFGYIKNATDGSEEGEYRIYAAVAGVPDTLVASFNAGLIIGSPTGSFKGTGTLNAAGTIYQNNVAVLVTSGALGTPSSGTLTNCTGLPVAGITSSTSTALGVGSLEIGHASDSTLSRQGAGVLAVESKMIYATGTVALSDGATPALDASLGSTFTLVAAGDRTIAVPSNAQAGQKIVIAHTASGANRTLSLNTGAGGFRFGTDITGLSATTSGLTDYIGCIYDAVDSRWDVIAYTKGF